MPSERALSVVILAAGEGTRMKSNDPKVLFTVCGRPIIDYVISTVSSLSPKGIVLVIGHKGEDVQGYVEKGWSGALEAKISFAWQKEQKGTGHAVMCARPHLPDGGDVLILNGDTTPLFSPELLAEFLAFYRQEGADLALISYVPDDPASYGRVLRGSGGNVTKIVEARDLKPAQKSIREVNSGIYLADIALLVEVLDEITDDNAKREYYLTDIVEIASRKGAKVSGMVSKDSSQVLGLNDRRELSAIEAQMRRRITDRLMAHGVTIRDPSSAFVDYGVAVGQDSIIEPNTYLRGSTVVGPNCVIGPGSEISNSNIGEGSRVWFSVVEDSDVGKKVQIGPYSHIRPNTTLLDDVLIGNFAEVKNSLVGRGTKIHHHSYTGDTDMGAGVNIGAGTVTVNYDGAKKHRTVIEDGAFIGCNTNLIAPVKVGKGAYVAAGSTINLEVPPGSLAIARERQVNIEGWVERKKNKGGSN